MTQIQFLTTENGTTAFVFIICLQFYLLCEFMGESDVYFYTGRESGHNFTALLQHVSSKDAVKYMQIQPK